MSATGRNTEGRERDPFDYYPTPEWVVHRLLDEIPHIRHVPRFLEPCAGDGAIIRAVRPTGEVTALEIQERFRTDLYGGRAIWESSPGCADNIVICDALDFAKKTADMRGRDRTPYYSVAITNPPFGIAFKLLKALLPICDEVILLLRLSFLASEERRDWLAENTPFIYVLPNRPKFAYDGTDNCDYAWMRWGQYCAHGLKILKTTKLGGMGR